MYERIKAKLDEYVEKLIVKEDLTSDEFSLLRSLYMDEKMRIDQKESKERFTAMLKGLDL